MYVRLAFAVAAHLEPEILIVDEVLAVGDAEFQKKCLGKMGEVASGGRTVLFVSHNLPAVSSLCNNLIVLADGRTSFHGDPAQGISRYLSPLPIPPTPRELGVSPAGNQRSGGTPYQRAPDGQPGNANGRFSPGSRDPVGGGGRGLECY